MLGLLMWLIILGFAALLAFKVIPIYLEAYKIDKAFTGIVSDPGVGAKTKGEIIFGGQTFVEHTPASPALTAPFWP